ncbi:MAG TPA: (2Fe-2S)-binding protein [Myxococcales bacterium]|nr:(2Fe-2S)-binding protein [Myxococcales bacterium]
MLRLVVNGEAVELAVRPHETLLEALRYGLRLTGSKQGCDKGDCGACTVRLGGVPTLACITLALDAAGRSVTTIEGLARDGVPDAVQAAFDRCGALQCGFCQSGMMVSARALLDENPKPSLAEIKQALSGNLCRCTGYTKILEAVQVAAGLCQPGEGPVGDGLERKP